MAWTTEQLDAIKRQGENIIVSAGAGSGKTAVLTTRVLEKVKENIHVDELLILTFTKLAAKEMKDRIKELLIKNNFSEELERIEKAYITTFDAFSFSLVKKYHYLLNLPQDIKITDESLLSIEKINILNNIFESHYKNDISFTNLINILCIKDDASLKKDILNIINKLSIRTDINNYLNTYFDTYYNNNIINNYINNYNDILLNKVNEFFNNINNSSLDKDYISKIYTSLANLKTNNLDDLIMNIKISKLPQIYKGATDEEKKIKESLNDELKKLKELTVYGTTNEITNDILKTKEFIKPIIDIIKEFFEELSLYKKNNDIFTYNDIAHISLELLKNNNYILEDLRNNFKEIMVDEYQDTSDIEEEFISLISHNNLYMVGDIKQSIYRFRNANPNIFKDKYNNYSKHLNGSKIDLLKNFRSRKEVLDNINTIFTKVMDNKIGGANYLESHMMNFGNLSYIEEGMTNEDYNMDILTYDEIKDYSKDEIEIFTIAKDIKEKVDNKYQIFDQKKKVFHDATYSDFCLILDRGTSFELTKMIFTYLNIPLSIYKDEELLDDNDLYLLKSMLTVLIKIHDKNYDTDYKISMTSLMRSYLYEENDQYIYDNITNKTTFKTKVYNDIKKVIPFFEEPVPVIINKLLESTNYYEKIIKVGNIEESFTHYEKLISLANDSSLNIYDYLEYINNLLEENLPLKYSSNLINESSVKIMNIHKSKGLEFPICYYRGLYKTFSKQDLKGDLIYLKDFPIYIPSYNEGIKDNIIKLLIKDCLEKEDISEKIRLFYVGLTRAKEKMIFLLPNKETNDEQKENGVIIDSIRYNYKSFADILYSIKDELKPYIKNIDINNINLSKDYKIPLLNESMKKNTIENNIIDLNIKNEYLKSSTYSKKNYELLTKEEINNMKLGTKVHETLELIDFYNPNLDEIDNELIKNIIINFLNQDILKDKDKAVIYQEYEFIYNDNNTISHGQIDLMLKYNDHIDIIDYKLNNITDENYLKQLNGYKSYINSISNLPVNIYLYSMLQNQLIKLN